MNRFALMLITDGRKECLAQTVASFRPVIQQCGFRLMVNDNPDPAWCDFLEEEYLPEFWILHPGKERRGFCGAIQAGWAAIPKEVEYVFHLEDDFVLKSRINLSEMARVLEASPHVAQMALKRQPWSPSESAAGGLVELWPHEYEDQQFEGHDFAEHSLFFTTNPSLYWRSLCDLGWPDGPRCEERFAESLRRQGFRFAYWGKKMDPPRVHHIGAQRVGEGY